MTPQDWSSAWSGASRTSTKLLLGFGTLIALLVLSSVAIIVRVRSIQGNSGEMTSARQLSAAARQLEIDTFAYALQVRAYLQTGQQTALQDAGVVAANVARQLRAYEGLAVTDRQRATAARIRAGWQELQSVGQGLLDAGANPPELDKSQRLYDLRAGLAALLDAEEQVAGDVHNDRQQATLRGVQNLLGFSLILLVVGVAIAVATSGAVGSAVVKSEESLRANRELLRVTLASIGDAVIATDTQGRVTYLNAVAESLTGWQNDEAASVPLELVFRIVSESTREPVESPATEAMREGAAVGRESHTLLIAKDGSERPIDSSAAPIRDEQGKIVGVVLIFRDITGRRQTENQLRQLAADLSDADRRKNEFLAMLAHELRNPLAPIRNALQIMRMTDGDGSALHSAPAMMERQVGQMVRLVDDLLDVSRISRGKIELRRERTDLVAAVDFAVEAARSSFDAKDHELTVTLPAQPIWLNADPTRLAQVIGNLLNNSCKFTEQGGRIAVTVEQQDQQAVLRVRDSGIGIAADHLPQVFDMFTQVDTSLERSVSGLGIGLTLVQTLVEMHGGKVEVHSAGVGHGSTFEVRLPIAVETPTAQPEPAVSEPRPSTARILVVDDNRDSATSLALLLTLQGNETETAYDGLEAVAMTATFRPDVVLLDIGLPHLNGYEVARRIRDQPDGKRMVLVAVTGWGQEEDRQQSREAGFDGHLVKPVDHAAVTKLLADLLASPA